MPYIIDGHNLLSQIPGLSRNDPADRQRLVRRLTEFARGRRCSITLFFDGEPLTGGAKDAGYGRVRVIHSGARRSADDAILDAIRRSRAPADCTLVTSDRALYERGRHLGAAAILGHKFREMLLQDLNRAPASGEKPERIDPGEVRYFMELFGAEDPPAPEAPSRSRRRR